jgi:alkylated DNA nucleotide flippase Atl1
MSNGQKYIDAAMEIDEGHWITYGELAQRVGVPARTGSRAAGQVTRWCDDQNMPMWRVFRKGGELPVVQETKSHSADSWRKRFERKWAEEGLLETVNGHRRARLDRHLSV